MAEQNLDQASAALPTADHIEAIRQIVVSFEQGVLTERIKVALDDGLLPEDIINQGLIMAMDIVGREFSAAKYIRSRNADGRQYHERRPGGGKALT